MLLKDKPPIVGSDKKMHSESTPSGSSAPMHYRTQNEHGWFWTLMHKSLRHH